MVVVLLSVTRGFVTNVHNPGCAVQTHIGSWKLKTRALAFAKKEVLETKNPLICAPFSDDGGKLEARGERKNVTN